MLQRNYKKKEIIKYPIKKESLYNLYILINFNIRCKYDIKSYHMKYKYNNKYNKYNQ